MTATHVNGIAVVADEAALAPIRDFKGDPVHFKQIRELLLADESTVFGCVHCEFTRPTAAGVRPHLRAHSEKTGSGKKRGMTLDELIRRVDGLKLVEAERDQWKARALEAEAKLASFRSVIKGL